MVILRFLEAHQIIKNANPVCGFTLCTIHFSYKRNTFNEVLSRRACIGVSMTNSHSRLPQTVEAQEHEHIKRYSLITFNWQESNSIRGYGEFFFESALQDIPMKYCVPTINEGMFNCFGLCTQQAVRCPRYEYSFLFKPYFNGEGVCV